MKKIVSLALILGALPTLAATSNDPALMKVISDSNRGESCPERVSFDFLKLLKTQQGEVSYKTADYDLVIEIDDKSQLDRIHRTLTFLNNDLKKGITLATPHKRGEDLVCIYDTNKDIGPLSLTFKDKNNKNSKTHQEDDKENQPAHHENEGKSGGLYDFKEPPKSGLYTFDEKDKKKEESNLYKFKEEKPESGLYKFDEKKPESKLYKFD